MARRIRFDFDEQNLDHLARHEVERREVMQAFRGTSKIVPAEEVGKEARWKLFGKTAKARFIVVVFTIRQGRIRTVTAYTMNRKERELYAKDLA
jgi:uncharacterized protein